MKGSVYVLLDPEGVEEVGKASCFYPPYSGLTMLHLRNGERIPALVIFVVPGRAETHTEGQ